MGGDNSKQAQEPSSQVRGGGQPEVQPDPAVPSLWLVLLGASFVGKSCLMRRYVADQFDPTSMATLGVDSAIQSVHLPDGTTVKLRIWDTTGVQRGAQIAAAYCKVATAAAVVYDITSRDSLTTAKRWVSELQKNASGILVAVLVGNKTDLAQKREVSEAEGREFASSQGMLFVETSAKTAANTCELFESVARQFAASSSAGTAQQPVITSPASLELPASQATA